MKYSVILFDADGVTIREAGMYSGRLEREHGIPKEVTRPFFKGIFQECMVGRADLKEELANVIADWGWKGTVDEMMTDWLSTGEVFDKNVLQLVRNLRAKGVHCFMTTNQEKYRGQHLRDQLKGSVYEELFLSCEVGAKKNQPEYFERVFEKLSSLVGSDKSRVLFIDDDAENISVARAFGVNAIHYRTFDDLAELTSSANA